MSEETGLVLEFAVGGDGDGHKVLIWVMRIGSATSNVWTSSKVLLASASKILAV